MFRNRAGSVFSSEGDLICKEERMEVGFFFFSPVKIKARYNPCKSTSGLSYQEVASVLLKEGQEYLKLFSESALSSD